MDFVDSEDIDFRNQLKYADCVLSSSCFLATNDVFFVFFDCFCFSIEKTVRVDWHVLLLSNRKQTKSLFSSFFHFLI